MSKVLTPKTMKRLVSAKTLHDLCWKPYKGKAKDVEPTLVDSVALLMMGSEGITSRQIQRHLKISETQVSHAICELDKCPYLTVKRKQGKFRNTQLYYI